MMFVSTPLVCHADARSLAYEDTPVPIGCDQMISQPTLVAQMLTWLDLKTGQLVLDVGLRFRLRRSTVGLLLGQTGMF